MIHNYVGHSTIIAAKHFNSTAIYYIKIHGSTTARLYLMEGKDDVGGFRYYFNINDVTGETSKRLTYERNDSTDLDYRWVDMNMHTEIDKQTFLLAYAQYLGLV